MTAQLTCARCRFWRELDLDLPSGAADHGDCVVTIEGTGFCRRYPPRRPTIHAASPDSSDLANSAAWPVTWAEDYCGEFVPKLSAVDPPRAA